MTFNELKNKGHRVNTDGKTIIKNEELIDKELTITDYRCFDGKNGRTAIVLYKELPDKYGFAPKIMVELLDTISNDDKAAESFHKDGIKIKFLQKTSKDGKRHYYSVETL